MESKETDTVARSSTEAEYRALAGTTSEVVWLTQLLNDLQVSCSPPAFLSCDNQAALHIASNPMFHECTKHIELDCYFVPDKVVDGLVKLLPVRTESQLADIFTKLLRCKSFELLLSKMDVCGVVPP